MKRAGDRLAFSMWFLIAVGTASVLMVWAVGMDLKDRARTQDQPVCEFYRAMGFSDFIFFPSGRPLRNYLAVTPAVDLRFTPFMPLEPPGPDRLLFPN